MHTVVLLAVEASSSNEAEEAALQWLDDNELGDWWVVGGRWAGYLDGDNVLQASSDPVRFDDAVAEMLRIRRERFNDLRQHLSGPDPSVPLFDQFGLADLAGVDPEGARERQHAWYRDSAATFKAMLSSNELPDESTFSLGYQLCRLGEMIQGWPHVDSGVIDTVSHSISMSALNERVANNPDRQWLVVVDVHT